MTPTSIVAYLALFASVGFLFVFVALLLGRCVRAGVPTPEKLEVYECGEPVVGSGFVQFDLRFYVVALVFINFDVEVAFFFPWATVFGKAVRLVDLDQRGHMAASAPEDSRGIAAERNNAIRQTQRELGFEQPECNGSACSRGEAPASLAADARRLALMAVADIGVFFAVLLVGFAYVWRQGDLDWVRAISRQGSHVAGAPGNPQWTSPV